jgi:hypothetical protein
MTVKRFGWKDRDTAAEDFLQLAYHGPERVRSTALDILQAIRSEKIVPELKAIALDQTWDYWDRIYALRAITSVRGDNYLPEFATLAAYDLANWLNSKERSGSLYREYLVDIRAFVEAHPSNEEWFWSVLNNTDDATAIDYINDILSYVMSEQWTRKLIEYLIKLIKTTPALLNLHSV